MGREILETPNKAFYDFIMTEYQGVIMGSDVSVREMRSGKLRYNIYTITGLESLEIVRVREMWMQKMNLPKILMLPILKR